MKAEELADAICRIDTLTEYQRELIAKAAAELRRLDALEQAAEPVVLMRLEDINELLHCNGMSAWVENPRIYPPYCEGEELVGFVPLYTHPAPRSPDMQDAYIGAMEDLSIWKRRALEAEELNREFIAETNGPTFMGEPLLPAHPARKPMTREDMRKLLAEHFDHEELTGADFSLIRAVERFHKIEE